MKRGDTLSLIAAMYGTTVEAITEANGIPPSAILSIGQQLIIPYPGPTGGVIPGMPTIPAGEIITYVVQRGDSLYSIANLYGTTVEVLMMVNGITDPELIQVGQELIISWEEPTPTATATPEPTPTPTPQPTSTPTTTPSFTPSATPPSTPQPTPQSTPPPMPTPTLAYPYPAPALLAPADGQVFQGTDQAIVLTWASVGILAQDEWYVVRLRYEAEGMDQPPNAWTKTTSWRVPAEVYPSSDVASRLFRWDVTIKRQTHTGPDGAPEGVDMSPVSSTRSFYWY